MFRRSLRRHQGELFIASPMKSEEIQKSQEEIQKCQEEILLSTEGVSVLQ
jgi:hypothetical protein